MTFRSVYVDRDVDAAVLARATRVGVTAGSVYRSFLEAGLAQLSLGAHLPEAPPDSVAVLRTCYVQCRSDDKLAALAIRQRQDLSELSRRVTRLGMVTIQRAEFGPKASS